jgi:hypothetical protein
MTWSIPCSGSYQSKVTKVPLEYGGSFHPCNVLLNAQRWGEGNLSKPQESQVLLPVILATQEAEMRRIAVRSQPGQRVHETYVEKTQHKKGWWCGSRCRT